MLPIADESMGVNVTVISASFADPYVLLIGDDSSIVLLEAEKSGDLEELNRGDAIMKHRWLSGSLYTDTYGTFGTTTKDGSSSDQPQTLLFLIEEQGGLFVRCPSPLATCNNLLMKESDLCPPKS